MCDYKYTSLRTSGLHRIVGAACFGLAALALLSGRLPAADTEPAVVSNVKVVSDKVPDVSSLAAWKKSFIKPGMTDKEEALTIWKSVCMFRHQDNPPHEFLASGEDVRDTIKTFNVYGYSMCDGASCGIEELSRYVGLTARGRGINRHSVPEVQWDGQWHLLDASLMTYFMNDKGKLASVQQIIDSVQGWYKEHPGYKGNDNKIYQFGKNMGWKNGPAVLATCPFYDENGWLPAKTHGFSSQMFEYDGSNNFEFEYGYNEGYRVNVQLRPGEVMTRNWSNKGLQVDMDLGSGPGCLNGVIGQGDLEYSRGLGDLANGRVGNGTIVYTVPLADAGLRDAALEYANLGTQQEDGQAPTLHVKTAGQPGTFVLRMASPYVYLGGSIELAGTVAKGGSVKVSFSRNNGEDWHDIGGVTAAGDFKTTLDLKPLLYRLYDYRLKFELNGVGTGLSALTIAEDMQHSQRALPALGQGSNTITFSAEPQEGTIAVEAHVGNKTKGNQLLLTEFHPQMEGVKQDEGALWMGDSGKGQITIPVTTPGVITHVRFGTHYRARSDKDQWAYELSFDGGKTWTTVDTVTGPTPATCKYDDFSQVPKGSRQVLVRFAGEQRNTLGIFDLSIHVDYIEPHGGFRPVQVTYLWTENGQEKKDVHVAKKPNETYTITCAGKPTMKSLIVELAK